MKKRTKKQSEISVLKSEITLLKCINDEVNNDRDKWKKDCNYNLAELVIAQKIIESLKKLIHEQYE